MPPQPEGFDFAAALARLSGNCALFASLARRFGKDCAALAEAAQIALQHGDRAAVARGAVVVWTVGDPNVVPIAYRNIAVDAAVQPPFTLPYRRGAGHITVGWAILLPRPSYAGVLR